MVEVRDLTELSLRALWSEVKDEEEWWGGVKEQALRGVKRVLEGATVLPRYQRRQEKVNQMVREMFLNGVSTRKTQKIRTTNAIERASREVRRRTRPMSCFQNSDSVDRITFGVISHLNKAWEAKPLNEITYFS